MIQGLNRTHAGAYFSFTGDNFNYKSRRNLDLDESFRINLSEPFFENPVLNGTSSGRSTWDVIYIVGSTEPDWERIEWQWIEQRNHRLIDHPNIGIHPYPGNDNVNRLETGWWYRDIGERNGRVDPGDELHITGLPITWDNEGVHLNTGTNSIGHFRLPSPFPYVLGSCEFSDPEVSTYRIGPKTFTQVEYRVIDVTSTGEDISLQRTFMTIDGGDLHSVGHSDFSFSHHPVNEQSETVVAWGVDQDGGGVLTVGDRIIFSGLTGWNAGATLYFFTYGMVIGQTRLPLVMEGWNSTIQLGFESVSSRDSPEGTLYDVAYVIDDLRPEDVSLPWTLLNATILDIDTKTVLSSRFQLTNRSDHNTSVPQCVFESVGTDEETLAEGDRILLLGLNRTMLSGTLHLDLDGIGLINKRIPSQLGFFDPADLDWSMDLGELEYEPVRNDEWKITMTFHNSTEGNEELLWSEITMEVVGWDGVKGDPMTLRPFPPEGVDEWDGYNDVTFVTWALEHEGKGTTIDEGDQIGITGISEYNAGVIIRLMYGPHRHLVYQFVLPGTLPTGSG